MRLDPQGRGPVFITIVNVVDNDDDNEFVNVAFFITCCNRVSSVPMLHAPRYNTSLNRRRKGGS
jgi:hypothetical protein